MRNQYEKLIQETYETVIELKKEGMSIDEIVLTVGTDWQYVIKHWLGDKPIRGNVRNVTGGNKNGRKSTELFQL